MSTDTDAWIASAEAEGFDRILAEYDCLATQAHVLMLARQQIMSEADARAALAALVEIEAICVAGEFRYEPGYGAQLTLEKMIVDRVGDHIGYQVHTGRSRNDQVLTAQKLAVRARLLVVMERLAGLVGAFVARAAADRDTVMPGYTHMQPARPTTVGQWCGAYADMFARDFDRLRDAYARHDSNPLGAAESHGTTWPLDRDYTRELLGFATTVEIPLDAISSRGESDADFLSGLAFLALHLSKFAQDLLLFNTWEYGYAVLGTGQAARMGRLTGSSIMPQKRNPDVLELLRGQASEIYSYLLHALEVLKALPSGYNRDSRDTKAPILRGLASLSASLTQAELVIDGVQFNAEAMLEAVRANHCMATDLAEYLAQTHRVPFREMHGIVGRAVKAAIEADRRVESLTPEEIAEQAAVIGLELTVSAEEIAAGTDPRAALARRGNIGGTTPERMEAWLADRRERAGERAAWARAETERVQAARARIRALAEG
ncbi:argininosuccinate lyase [Conexibacter sp. DBS9H8]|uniref:argininosuccinate lyase n=1 Tax=Conexibacter sp. DBS9H8 TaxID=2937801 RepID=UPI00273A64B4|nr:argininosuccinate lyase [Conexibacter sp. DBS9H8]